jgi:hypothetical protein
MAFKLKKAICGGQTGVDQIMLSAAKKYGFPTGGTAAKGWMTEDGPAPWLADYGLVECPIAGYPTRTAKNVIDSQGTVLFGDPNTPGSVLVKNTCDGRRPLILNPNLIDILTFVVENNIEVLNVAGNRSSKLTTKEGMIISYTLRDLFQIIKLQQK